LRELTNIGQAHWSPTGGGRPRSGGEDVKRNVVSNLDYLLGPCWKVLKKEKEKKQGFNSGKGKGSALQVKEMITLFFERNKVREEREWFEGERT